IRGQRAATIDVAAGDRRADRVVVVVDRIDDRRERDRTAAIVIVRALAQRPAVVAPAAPARLVVDLLPEVLSDVADHERAGAASPRIVEAVAPRVAQPEGPDLGSCGDGNAAHEGIVARHLISHRVRVGYRHVDAQHLAEQLLWILRAVAGIAAR